MWSDVPDWMPKGPELDPTYVDLITDPVSRGVVVAIIVFWFAFHMVEGGCSWVYQ